MKLVVHDKPLVSQKTDGFLCIVPQDFKFSGVLEALAKEHFKHLKECIKHKKFTGKLDQQLVFEDCSGKTIKTVILVGIGKETSAEEYRRAVASGIRAAEAKKIDTLAFELPDPVHFNQSFEQLAQITATTALMAWYRFNEFITNKDAKGFQVKEFAICCTKEAKKNVESGVKTGTIIGEAVNRSRHWVDLPANKLTPGDLADKAKKLAKEYALECTVFDEKQIEKLGMGGLKAVGMASKHDSHLVILQYSAKSKKAPTLALVGKGITFDSGGLNLKPTGYMETMKEDMTGAAAVINTMVAISQLKPDVNVVGLAAIAENMVSGEANHPGDIITFYNGKTALVGNTDAEGRLVLADALAYASKHFKPTAMIDVATLTGAVSHAVGPFFNGVLTQNDELAEKVKKAGESSGDATWRLPFIERYKKMVETPLADVCNDGKTAYKAGPTNGACFLSHFVGDTPWVHVDIAATAFDVPDTPYYRSKCATGSGTRLLIDFVMQWK